MMKSCVSFEHSKPPKCHASDCLLFWNHDPVFVFRSSPLPGKERVEYSRYKCIHITCFGTPGIADSHWSRTLLQGRSSQPLLRFSIGKLRSSTVSVLTLLDLYWKAFPPLLLTSVRAAPIRCHILCAEQGREREGSWASRAPGKWAPLCPPWPGALGFGWKRLLSQAQLPGEKFREWPPETQNLSPCLWGCPPPPLRPSLQGCAPCFSTLPILCFISGHPLNLFPDVSSNPWTLVIFLAPLLGVGGLCLCRQLVCCSLGSRVGRCSLLPAPLLQLFFQTQPSLAPGCPETLSEPQRTLLAAARWGRSLRFKPYSGLNLSLCICSFPSALGSPEPLPAPPPK